MSDPVENYEIEDVLSSIRRLVSQESARSNADPPPESVDAFVLTPEARVDADQGSPEPPSDEVGDEGLRRDAASAVRSELERAIEELEAAMGIAGEAATPGPEDPGAELTSIDWEAPVGRAMDGPPPEAEPDVKEPEPEESAAPDERAEASPMPITPPDEDVESPEGTSVLDPGAPVEPVGEEEAEADAWVDATQTDPSPVRSASERLHLVSSQGGSDTAASGPYEEFYTDAAVSQSISPQLEATLADQAESFDAPEPPFDSMKDDPFTAAPTLGAPDEPMSVEVVTEPEAETDTQAVTQAEAETETEVSLDEEQLRDMVAEIVREELQGELGERITRNVRRLVRREINRALAGQDLI